MVSVAIGDEEVFDVVAEYELAFDLLFFLPCGTGRLSGTRKSCNVLANNTALGVFRTTQEDLPL